MAPDPPPPAEGVAALATLLHAFDGEHSLAIAASLMAQYGSLASAIGAPLDELTALIGQRWAALIVGARALVEAGLRERVTRRAVSSGDPDLHDYLRLRMGGLAFEELFAIFLDGDGCYIHAEAVGHGTADAVSVPLVHLVHRARQLRARQVLLAHNHPSRQPRPSATDIAATRKINAHCAAARIELIDHLVVAGETVTSIGKEAQL